MPAMTPEERDAFLSGLVHGLRVDFSKVSLDDVGPADGVVERSGGAIEVPLECPAPFGADNWSAGTLVVSCHEGAWLVDHLRPMVSGGG